jgi:YfiH family protein
VNESLLEMDWELPRGVFSACTTRLGGVSKEPWDSFNLATHVGDDLAHVAANRARLRELLKLDAEPAWLNQVHGVAVKNLEGAPFSPIPLTADAAVATRAAAACVVMVADCLPVLFCSSDGQRVGAAHAGWRGLAAGVLERAVEAMGVPAHELRAWLGPAISQEHFEVGDEVREVFVKADRAAISCFRMNARGRWQADLVGLARLRLASLGLTDVAGGRWCTFTDRERFFSHRRDGKGGRLAALIWCQKT